MSDSFIELGSVAVHTSQNKGHDPEFWAAQATKKYVTYLWMLQSM